MWPFKKKVRQRRLEVRKKIRASEPAMWKRFREAGGLGAVTLAVVFYLGATLLVAWPLDPLNYRVGQYVDEDIYARVEFSVQDPIKAERAMDAAREATPATFQLNETLVDEITQTILKVPQAIATTTQPADVEDERLRQFVRKPEALDAWKEYAQPDKAKQLQENVQKLREALGQTLIVREQDADAQRSRPPKKIWAVQPRDKELRDISQFITQRESRELKFAVPGLTYQFDRRIRDGIETYLLELFTTGRVLYRYDKAATERDMAQAVEAVPEEQKVTIYEEGQLLVPSTRRRLREQPERPAGLTESELGLLQREHAQWTLTQVHHFPWQRWGRGLGRAIYLAMLTLGMCLYITVYQPRVVRNHWRAFSIAAVMLLMLAVSKVTVFVLNWNEHTTLLPVLMAGIVFTIAYSRRFALAVGLTLALLTVLEVDGGVLLAVVLLTSMCAAVFPLREIRTRTKLIQVAALAAAAAFVTVWGGALANSKPWNFALADAIWAAGSALLVGFLVQGILPAIERVFSVATSTTLLEWCDANKPLLKRLAMEAPGTYNHSLQLGTMCEAAAEAIGARGLVARVGAYYHDVGKINKPRYFVENEGGSGNKHKKLSPAMSLLIIIGHVKDGLELAREYGLPRVLHEFISTHHGTTLVQYFYHAATEKRKEAHDRAPDEVEFRYPGPKPRSKEAAILMLADACESSVRAMSEPTPVRIENQVHTMVQRRLEDGQLDECELTLREVHAIEQSLIKSLCSFYHGRITYPTAPGQKPAASESKDPAASKEQAGPKATSQEAPDGDGNGKEASQSGEQGESSEPPQDWQPTPPREPAKP